MGSCTALTLTDHKAAHRSFADVEKGIAALGDKAKASKLAEWKSGDTATLTAQPPFDRR